MPQPRARGPRRGRPTPDPGPVAPDASSTNKGGEQVPPAFQFFVRGQVLYRHGLPIERATVIASHVDLRSETELGRARTDSAGNYEIYYRADAFPGRAPDLRVRAEDRKHIIIASSRVLFSAPPI